MESKHLMASVAILCLTILESVALLKELDGAYFLPIVASISAITGGVLGYGVKRGSEKLVV